MASIFRSMKIFFVEHLGLWPSSAIFQDQDLFKMRRNANRQASAQWRARLAPLQNARQSIRLDRTAELTRLGCFDLNKIRSKGIMPSLRSQLRLRPTYAGSVPRGHLCSKSPRLQSMLQCWRLNKTLSDLKRDRRTR